MVAHRLAHHTEDIPDVSVCEIRMALKQLKYNKAVLFFKKGDDIQLKNYRPIVLLSHVYKLFLRVRVTNRLPHRFYDFQPPEQSAFCKD